MNTQPKYLTAVINSEDFTSGRVKRLAGEAEKQGVYVHEVVVLDGVAVAAVIVNPKSKKHYNTLLLFDERIQRWVIRCNCLACTPTGKTKAGEDIPSQICKHGCLLYEVYMAEEMELEPGDVEPEPLGYHFDTDLQDIPF